MERIHGKLYKKGLNEPDNSDDMVTQSQTFWSSKSSGLLDSLLLIREKAMAPHSSTLAWKIPWTEEPGRLQSMGSLRVGHD